MGAGRESKHVAVIVDSARQTKKPPYISAWWLVIGDSYPTEGSITTLSCKGV